MFEEGGIQIRTQLCLKSGIRVKEAQLIVLADGITSLHRAKLQGYPNWALQNVEVKRPFSSKSIREIPPLA